MPTSNIYLYICVCVWRNLNRLRFFTLYRTNGTIMLASVFNQHEKNFLLRLPLGGIGPFEFELRENGLSHQTCEPTKALGNE